MNTTAPGSLSVLFAVRDDLHAFAGGDTVQIDHTAAELSALGVKVTLSADSEASLAEYDLVHLWHLDHVHGTYPHFLNARRHRKPMVLSPIFWPRGRAKQPVGGARHRLEDGKNLFRLLLNARTRREKESLAKVLRIGWGRCRREILEGISAILPNSMAEANAVLAEAGRSIPHHPVPNGCDPGECRAAIARPRAPQREGVLCVGHFDPRKNQAALIRALRGSDIPVTFVGGARRLHTGYYRICQWLATSNMRFLGVADHATVLDRMRAIRVHVCPSVYETPGLVNLEAAAMGCALAIGDCPPVREYFGDRVVYFNSRNIRAIRRAVEVALAAPPPTALAEEVLTRYTWQAAALATVAAYRQVLGSTGRHTDLTRG